MGSISSLYYSQSNGHAEACVKQLKHLTIKTSPTNLLMTNLHKVYLNCETLHEKMDVLLNLLLGRPLGSFLPTHRSVFDQKWDDAADKCDQKRAILQDQAVEHKVIKLCGATADFCDLSHSIYQ
ncbi:uncharacterized protein LOC134783403 [Penaeus indicus]|uniref:uncharacterized protein LOC134783403 n=1 Tax=Penaeus indicus TaxID=29960 RepID=UPI00300BFB62